MILYYNKSLLNVILIEKGVYSMSMEKENFQQINMISYMHKHVGSEVWFIAYKELSYNGGFYCTLVDNSNIPQSMSNVSWDLSIGSGLPSCTCYNYKSYDEKIKYHRFGEEKIQPLVYLRTFYGLKPGYIEISEEFRHYHNLYFDSTHNKYIKIDKNGDEEDIVVIETDNTVKIKLKAIKQFLAIKNMSLLFFFDCNYYSDRTLDELEIPKTYDTIKQEENLIYSYAYIDVDWGHENHKSFSKIIGKKLIKGYPIEKCGIWPYNEEEKEIFDDFIIGINELGEEITYTSNPDELADYFGKNPHAPHYLTPVYFKREVLNKYFNEPNKYSVTDGYISCGDVWGLRLDNNRKEHIMVFLGDLGRSLNHKERLYWKSFNIIPDGKGMSETCWKRAFAAEFCDPQCLDLKFKQVFLRFKSDWYKKYSWDLFLPLNKDDEYHFQTLHIPTDNQSEFDEQIRGLVKMLIDSLNEKKLEELNGQKITGSINKLEYYLQSNNINDFKSHIDFLKKLQNLRSSAIAHRKGTNYENIAKVFGIGKESYVEVFENILNQCIELLEFLDEYFLKNHDTINL